MHNTMQLFNEYFISNTDYSPGIYVWYIENDDINKYVTEIIDNSSEYSLEYINTLYFNEDDGFSYTIKEELIELVYFLNQDEFIEKYPELIIKYIKG